MPTLGGLLCVVSVLRRSSVRCLSPSLELFCYRHLPCKPSCFRSQGSNSATATSWTAGGQAGYNWQQGSFVYGFETDLSGTGLKSSMSGGLTNLSCFTDTAGTNSNVDWYGTVRGRAGWTAGKALFYGTGGLAYGGVDLNSSFNTAGVSLNSQTSSVRTGWVLGGGVEYMWQPNLVLTLGYQYVDLGTANVASSTLFLPK